ncbi:hypothetical protein EPN42_05615 [bacterium]|nr:MAG: hypothetical protein EPN42_05615 [bacterium]
MKRTEFMCRAGALSLSGVIGRISSVAPRGVADGVLMDSLFGAPADSAAMLPDHYTTTNWGQALFPEASLR